jgi:tripartite-type tricarboxylate transporter receptor subunit TctC
MSATKFVLFGVLAFVSISMLGDRSHAQSFPSKTLTIVVPFPAGGGVDAVARAVQSGLSSELKQPVVIENRPGAAGSSGIASVARSPADGYTLAITNNPPITQNEFLQLAIPYAAEKALAPVGIIADTNIFVVVNAKMPVSNITELVKYAKDAKKPLTYGSAGPGSTYHIAGEMIRKFAEVELDHVPYRGTAQMTQDLLSGVLDVSFGTPTAIMPFVESNQLRVIAVIDKKPHPSFPRVDPVAKHYPDVVTETWVGLFAPAGTPSAIVQMLNDALNKVLKDPTTAEAVKLQGWFPATGTSDSFGRLLDDERRKWRRVLPAIGLFPQ